MAVNLFGQIYGLNTFLPLIRAKKSPSAIVMTGSKQGETIQPPDILTYTISRHGATRSIS